MMADEMAKPRQAEDDLGLSAEELVFNDAIIKPEAVKDFYSQRLQLFSDIF